MLVSEEVLLDPRDGTTAAALSLTCSTTRLITLRARLATLGALRFAAATTAGALRAAAAAPAPAAAPATALAATARRTVFLVGRLRAAFRAAWLRLRLPAELFEALRFAVPRRAVDLDDDTLRAEDFFALDFRGEDFFDDFEDDFLDEDFFEDDFEADFLLLLPADFRAPPLAPPFFEPPFFDGLFFVAAMSGLLIKSFGGAALFSTEEFALHVCNQVHELHEKQCR